MVILTGCWTFDLLLVLVIGLFSLFCWHQNKVFSYWRIRGVPSVPIDDWLFGNVREEVLKKSSWFEFAVKYYHAFKETGYGGIYIFTRPTMVICDPNLIEKVLVEDFSYFQDRFDDITSSELLSSALFETTGAKWRTIRSKLIPAFTSGKIKGMFDQALSCCESVFSELTHHAANNDNDVDIERFAFLFATETIASCCFGIQMMSDPIEKSRLKRIIDILYNPPPRQLVKLALFWMNPKILTLLRSKLVQNDVTEYFVNMTKAAIQLREQVNLNRNDFLQMMMSLKNQEESNSEQVESLEIEVTSVSGTCVSTPTERIFTEECIASQMFNFIQAGSASNKVTISFVLFELSKSVKVQRRVQKSIDLAILKHKGWTFEAIKDMTYLDQVIQETMRIHTYNPILSRTVTKAYRLPGSGVTLEKGTMVHILPAAIHKDPQFYPDPETFDPDRFAGNNYRPSSAYMPFGHGPRICMSIKYAVMMMKVFLAKVLSEYDVKVSSKMKSPVSLDRSVYFPQVEGGIWLALEKRK